MRNRVLDKLNIYLLTLFFSCLFFISYRLKYKKHCLRSCKVLMSQCWLKCNIWNWPGLRWRGTSAIMNQFEANDADLIMSCVVLTIKLIFISVRTYVSKHKTQNWFLTTSAAGISNVNLNILVEVAQLYSKEIQAQKFSIGLVSNFTEQIFFVTLFFGVDVSVSSGCDFSVYRFPLCSSKYLSWSKICFICWHMAF